MNKSTVDLIVIFMSLLVKWWRRKDSVKQNTGLVDSGSMVVLPRTGLWDILWGREAHF